MAEPSTFLMLIGDLVADTYCWVHDELEPRSENPYLVCFECGHVYETEADLERDYMEERPKDTPITVTPVPADEIYFCPHCLHDF